MFAQQCGLSLDVSIWRPSQDVLTSCLGLVVDKILNVSGLVSVSLSLSHSRSGWAGHRPNPFQVAPEASWVGSEGVSWPGVPPGVIVGRTLEHQMLDRLVGAVAEWADGRVPACDPVKVSCYQWGMTVSVLAQKVSVSRFGQFCHAKTFCTGTTSVLQYKPV